jgi:predicted phage tail component-like protein
MLSIYFNNKSSKDDFNLIIEEKPSIPSPEKNIIKTEVEGRNGSLTEDLGTHKEIEISINFSLYFRSNLNNRLRQIKQWLLGTMIDKKLTFSDDLDYFYKVTNVKIGDIARTLAILGRFTVTFTCEPFLYAKEGLNIVSLTMGNINNHGAISFPVITIYGSGSITLGWNDTEIVLTNVSEYITIDSQMMNCYKGSTLMNSNMSGDFPKLQEGINNINWTGAVTKIDMIPNWCYL